MPSKSDRTARRTVQNFRRRTSHLRWSDTPHGSQDHIRDFGNLREMSHLTTMPNRASGYKNLQHRSVLQVLQPPKVRFTLSARMPLLENHHV